MTVSANLAVPSPTETPYLLNRLGPPAFTAVAFGEPAPQGSKIPGQRKNGSRYVREASKKVKPWRAAVVDQVAAVLPAGWIPLDDDRAGVVLDLVFTIHRPTTRPKRWRCRPAVKPDLDKLIRSTLDALTTAKVLGDDGRVVGFRRVDEFYVGDPDPDTLPTPGVLIRVWPLPLEAQ